jgi:hypothetical protein
VTQMQRGTVYEEHLDLTQRNALDIYDVIDEVSRVNTNQGLGSLPEYVTDCDM